MISFTLTPPRPTFTTSFAEQFTRFPDPIPPHILVEIMAFHRGAHHRSYSRLLDPGLPLEDQERDIWFEAQEIELEMMMERG